MVGIKLKIKLERIYFIFSLLLALAIAMQIEYIFFGIANFLPLIMILFIFLVIFLFCLINFDYVTRREFLFLYTYLFLISVFFLMWSNYINLNLFTRTSAFLIYIILSCFVINHLLNRLNSHHLYLSFLMGIIFSTVVLIAEFLFRVINPSMAIKGDLSTISNEPSPGGLEIGLDFFESKAFYAYKYSSIMFYDSNYVGLFALSILICTYFLAFKFRFNLLYVLLIFTNSLLVFLSFSRSAIFSMFIISLFYIILYLYNNKKWFLLIFILFSLFSLFSLSLFNIILFISSDESFITKISIFSSMKKFFDFDVLNMLFGYGLLDGGYAISYQEGKYAHALVPVLLGQIGIIGLLVYLISFTIMCFKSGTHGIVLLFSFLITGISLVDPWQIIYFWSALYMLHLKKIPDYTLLNKHKDL